MIQNSPFLDGALQLFPEAAYNPGYATTNDLKFTRTAHVVKTVAIFLALVDGPLALAQSTIDAAKRTVTTRNFSITWNTGVDAEAITALDWMGGSNLTIPFGLDTCGSLGGNVQYFGNGWAPPDPQSGGLVLVGDGTITPPGTVPWSGQIVASGFQVTINSNSTNCPPSSAGINVQTTYRFPNPTSGLSPSNY